MNDQLFSEGKLGANLIVYLSIPKVSQGPNSTKCSLSVMKQNAGKDA